MHKVIKKIFLHLKFFNILVGIFVIPSYISCMQITLPQIGNLKLEKNSTGFFINLASKNKPRMIGPLKLTQGILQVSADKKKVTIVDGKGDLFKKSGSVTVNSFKFKIPYSELSELKLLVNFATDKPQINFPEQNIEVHSAQIMISKTIITNAKIMVGTHLLNFQVTKEPQAYNLRTKVNNFRVSGLFPSLKNSFFGEVIISNGQLNIEKVFRIDGAEKTLVRLVQLKATGDLSSVPLAGGQSAQIHRAPLEITLNLKDGFTLKALLKEIDFSGFDKITNANLVLSYLKEKKIEELSGNLILSFPEIGKINVAIKTPIKEKDMVLRGTLTIPQVTYQNNIIKNPQFLFQPKSKHVILHGKNPKGEKIEFEQQLPQKKLIVKIANKIIEHKIAEKAPKKEKKQKPITKPKEEKTLDKTKKKSETISIDVPNMGNITLQQVFSKGKKNQDQPILEGYKGEIASEQKPLKIAALTITSGDLFLRADKKKIIIDAHGKLFGKNVKIDIEKSSISSVGIIENIVLRLLFIKDSPLINFLPGLSAEISSAHMTLIPKKLPTTTIFVTILGEQKQFTITPTPQGMLLTGTLPSFVLSTVFPQLMKTQFGQLSLSNPKIRIENPFTDLSGTQNRKKGKEQAKNKKQKIKRTVEGTVDLSSLIIPNLNFDTAKSTPLKISFIEGTSKFIFEMPKLIIPVVGSINQPRIHITIKKDMHPNIRLVGAVKTPFKGLPADTLSFNLDSVIHNKSIDFIAYPTGKKIVYEKYSLTKPKIEIDPEKKMLIISGTAIMNGISTVIEITKDDLGKINFIKALPKSFSISLPGIKKTFTAKKIDKPKEGYEVILAAAKEPFQYSGLTLSDGRMFISSDGTKITGSLRGSLLNNPILITVKNGKFNITQKIIERLTLTLKLQKPHTYPVLPGLNFSLLSGEIQFKKEEDIILTISGKMFDKTVNFTVTEKNDSYNLSTKLSPISFAQLLPLVFAKSVLDQVQILESDFTIYNFISKTPQAKEKETKITLSGESDVSNVNMGKATGQGLKKAPTSFSYSKKTGYVLSIDINAIQIPSFAALRSTKIVSKAKAGKTGAIRLTGSGVLTHIISLGKPEINLDTTLRSKDIIFKAILDNNIKYKQFEIKAGAFVDFSTKDKTALISGITILQNVETKITLEINPDGSIEIQVGKVSIDFPVLGSVTFEPISRPPGYEVIVATHEKPLIFGPCSISQAKFFLNPDYKLSLTGKGKLFGKSVTVSMTEVTIDKVNKRLNKLMLSLAFEKKQEPKIDILPGLSLSMNNVALVLEHGKPIIFIVKVTIAKKTYTFYLTPEDGAFSLTGNIPSMKLGQLLPAIKIPPFNEITLSPMTITGSHILPFTKLTMNKKPSVVLQGTADTSEVPVTEEPKKTKPTKSTKKHTNSPTTISYSDLAGVFVSMDIPKFRLPVVGDVEMPKLSTNYKKGETPEFTLNGNLAVNFPGLPNNLLNLKLDAQFKKDGFAFTFNPKDLSLDFGSTFKEFSTITHPKISVSSKEKTITIGGTAQVANMGSIAIQVTRDAAGKVTWSMGSISLNIPYLGTVALTQKTDPELGLGYVTIIDKKITIGNLDITKLKFFVSNDKSKALLQGTGTFLDTPIEISTQGATLSNREISLIKLNIKSKKGLLGFDLLPGKKVILNNVILTLEKDKLPEISAQAEFLKQTFLMSFGSTKKSTPQITFSLKHITFGDLVEQAGPLKNIAIPELTLVLTDPFASSKEGSSLTMKGVGDFSKVDLGGIVATKKLAVVPLIITFGKIPGIQFNVTLPNMKLPESMGGAALNNAYLNFSLLPNKPVQIALGGNAKIQFTGFPYAFDTDLKIKYKNNDFIFAGDIKNSNIKFGTIVLPKASLAFDTKKQTLSVSGEARVKTYDTIVTITSDFLKKKLYAQAEIKAGTIEPFKATVIPGLKDIKIKKPRFIIELGDDYKFKQVQLAGSLDLFGIKNMEALLMDIKDDKTDKTGVVLDAKIPLGFTFSMLSPKLKNSPFDWIKLTNAHFVLTQISFIDPLSKIQVQPGINVFGDFNFEGPLKGINNFRKVQEPIVLGGYFNPIAITKSGVIAGLPSVITIPGKTVTLGPTQFFVTAEPIAYGLKTSLDIKPSPKDRPITVAGTIKLEAIHPTFEGEIDNWNRPLGLPFNLNRVWFKIGFAPEESMAPSALGVAGDILINKRRMKAIFNVDQMDPLGTIIYASMKGKLCLTDIVLWFRDIQRTMGLPVLPQSKLPELCITNPILNIAPPMSYQLAGKTDILGTLIDINYQLDPTVGIIAKNSVTPFTIYSGKTPVLYVSGAPEAKDKKAIIDFSLTLTKQQYLVSGLITIKTAFGNLSDLTFIEINLDGMKVHLQNKLAAMQGDFTITAPLTHKPNFVIVGEFKKFMGTQVINAIDSVINPWRKSAIKNLNKAMSICASGKKCEWWDIECHAKEAVCGAMQAMKQINTALTNLENEIKRIKVDSIGFKIDLVKLIKGGQPSVWFKGSYKNHKLNIKIENVDPRNVPVFMAQVSQEVLKIVENDIDPTGILKKI